MAEQEIQEATIKSQAVETRTYQKKDGSGSGTIYNIGADDGKVYTTFSDTVAKIFETAGTERKIKFQVRIQGQYTNLVILDVADEKGEFKAKVGGSYKGGMKADPAKMNSIERQVAAIQTVLLINAGTVKLADFEVTADRLIKWIGGGNGDTAKAASNTKKP